MSVNAAPSSLVDPTYLRQMSKVLEGADIAPSQLVIELTEQTLLTDTRPASRIIEDIKQLGVRIAIDDFGTGYSSLSQLTELRFDLIKIDRSFVTNMDTESGSTVLRGLISLADALGLPTTAEGIETSQHLSELLEIGATYGQGYLIARPLPAEQALEYAAGDRQTAPTAV